MRFNGEPDFNQAPLTQVYDLGAVTVWADQLTELCAQRLRAWSRLAQARIIKLRTANATVDVESWVKLIKELWPGRPLMLMVRPSDLDHYTVAQCQDWIEQGVVLEIQTQGRQQWRWGQQWAEAMCGDLVGHAVLELLSPGQQYLVDDQVIIRVTPCWDQTPEFHNSDPATAHWNCTDKHQQYLVNGVLYKCPVTALSAVRSEPQLLAQSRCVDPLTAKTLNSWFATLDQPVPQCRLCPTQGQVRISLDSLTKPQAHPATLAHDVQIPTASSEV